MSVPYQPDLSSLSSRILATSALISSSPLENQSNFTSSSFCSSTSSQIQRGSCKIRIPRHHNLVKGVGLNRKIPTRFGDMVVWDGDDSGDRILCTRDGFTRKNVRVGVVECVAALAQEGQPKDAMVDVKFHSVGVDTNGEVLKTQKGSCDQPGHA